MKPYAGLPPYLNGSYSGELRPSGPGGLTSPTNTTSTLTRCAPNCSSTTPVYGSVPGEYATHGEMMILSTSGNACDGSTNPQLHESVRRITALPTASKYVRESFCGP